MTKADLSHLMALRRYLLIAHHVKGRLRLRLRLHPEALNAAPPESVRLLQDWLKAQAGIMSLRLNKAALSIVIDYDPVLIPPTDWTRLLEGDEDEAVSLFCRFAATA
ncbi:MAG: heavy-metal-associated domain-containing protein [Rhodospirillales bacterium]|nr:heavy-metal-associated domain-containing protein [Rhodospirillales bacterium]